MKRIVALLVGVVTMLALWAVPAQAEDLWWHPSSATALPLHWVLAGPIDVNNPVHVGEVSLTGDPLPPPAVLDIDGFDNPAETVTTLHARGQKVVCYFSAGSWENWRPDAGSFPEDVKGNTNGWPGERWLDIRRLDVLGPIMTARMQMCKDKGFDAIEPDNIDGYTNSTGFPLTAADQLTYNRWLASTAHSLGLGALQKNDGVQIQDLVGDFDAILVEQCAQFGECDPYWDGDTPVPGLDTYVAAGKAVWVAEYRATPFNRLCGSRWNAVARHWNGARYRMLLEPNDGRQPCPGTW